MADDDFALKREIVKTLKVKVLLVVKDNERWAKISCILGATDYNISLYIDIVQ